MSDWTEQAACRGMNTTIWFPLPSANVHTRVATDRAEHKTALDVCARCPVTEECAAAGRREPGIWGGLLERERDPRRARARVRSRERAAEKAAAKRQRMAEAS